MWSLSVISIPIFTSRRSAAKVCTLDNLCESIVLLEFKNAIPQHIATYVNEQKASTALKTAELADDFVLTHNSKPQRLLQLLK